uniref:Vinexin n=1 Tax=Homo sapiens TaxID=9606 RepID=UPI0000E5D232|nr:Chain A, Vinexin [Homo sapiens]
GSSGSSGKAARLKFDFQAQSPKELTLQKGDIVYIHKEVDKNWLEGEHHGRLGIFPANYVEVLSGPSSG